ncbi:MAG: DUF2846 domain-containing protein [Terracidiphilus sp.]|jgi:hypothetical protein
MKVLVLALFVASSVFVRAQVGHIASACGPYSVTFKVKLDEKDHSPAQAAQGKALVYFIHDSGTSAVIAYPTTKMGVDGAWVGANHSNSYFYVSVEPGEHHVCADLQTSLYEDRTELAHFRAEAGKVYYFRTRLVTSRSVELLELDPLDSDQGSYLISLFPLSVSTAKKGEKGSRYSDQTTKY